MVDILIIGSGASALSAALLAKEQGLHVIVYSKTRSYESGSCMAQGGINVVFDEQNDSIKNHINDTLLSSKNIADRYMVEKMCKNAKDTVVWLENLGVAFSKNEDGTFAQRKLGAASASRACYAQDFSGLKIMQALSDSCIKHDIEIKEEFFLLNIYNEGTKVATFLDISNSEIVQVEAKNIILATGGYASVYKGYSTNRDDLVGGGCVAAFKAGIKLSDLEFVQFHPTSLKKSSILISESARGAGGIIYDQNKNRFVDELATRDEVSRKIYEQLQKGNDVFLDITHIDHEFLEENLPQEIKLARTYEGVNLLLEPIAIKPAAHYSMGGIDVDHHMQSSQRGIFAIGECANAKIHGANRLGGNSLLEVVSLAKVAVDFIYSNNSSCESLKKDVSQNDKKYIASLFELPCKVDFYEKRELLGEIMYKYCGIFKDEKGLLYALKIINQMKNEFKLMGIKDKSKRYNTNLIDFLEFLNALYISEIIVISALHRKESRGAHYRNDFPEFDNDFEVNQEIWLEKEKINTNFIRNSHES